MSRRLKVVLSRTVTRLKASVAHAFAVPSPDEPLSPADQALLERMAETVVRRGMAAPAAFFLESVGPLNFLGSQVLHGLAPLLNLACEAGEFDRAARLLERRESLSRLAALIEAKSAKPSASVAAPR